MSSWLQTTALNQHNLFDEQQRIEASSFIITKSPRENASSQHIPFQHFVEWECMKKLACKILAVYLPQAMLVVSETLEGNYIAEKW